MTALLQLDAMFSTQVHPGVVQHLVPVFLPYLVVHVLELLLNVPNVIWCWTVRRRKLMRVKVKSPQLLLMEMFVNINARILVDVR